MPKPATFTPAEISALAARLREVWRPGSQITPWLRDHAERLTRLNREERFSWAAVAAALNEAGIVYRTGNPWTASNLAKAVSEVRPGGRGNPTPEQKAEIAAAMAAWKAEEDAAKAKQDAAFAAEWESMTEAEQHELLAAWGAGELRGTPAARFFWKSGYRKPRVQGG